MNLQNLKNNYAQEQGYEDWDDLNEKSDYVDDYENHWTNICIRAQKEALKKAAENGVAYKLTYPNNTSKAVVEKDSIINPENLIQ